MRRLVVQAVRSSRWLVLVVAGAAAVGVFFAGLGGAAPTSTYSVSASAASVSAGSPVGITFTNDSGSVGSFGWVELTVAGAGLESGSVSVSPSSGPAADWSVSASGDTIDVTNNGNSPVAPNDSLTVTVVPDTTGSFAVQTQAGTTSTSGDFANSGSDPSLAVTPGPLDHFGWSTIGGSQTAGQPIPATVTAYDAYGNVDTDYTGASATISGLADGPSGPSASYDLTWSGGVATGTATGYGTQSGAELSVVDGDTSISANSNSFDVGPAAIGSFAWTAEPGASQVAGTAFTAGVTAYDLYGNVKTDYAGGATLTGLGDAPNDSQVVQSAIDWENGIGSGTFTTYLTAPAGTAMTLTDGTATGTSDSFTVAPGPLGSFAWTTEPGSSYVAGATVGAAVTAYDQYGNVKTDYAGTPAWSGLHQAPDGSDPLYASFSSGVASGFVDYRTEPGGTAITVTDGSASATSDSFTVTPAALRSFGWTTEPAAQQTAGVSFAAQATAYDLYGNVKTDYPGADTPSVTGLHDAPNGSHTASYSVSWSGGVASGTFTGYRTEPGPTGTTLEISNGDGTITADSSSFDVAPGPLGSFAWTTELAAGQTAGVQIAGGITAYDVYGNVKTDYAGGASLSGLHTSPTSPPIFGGSPPGGNPPSYGTLTWTAGVAPLSGVIDRDAEAAALTVADGSVTATSDGFVVVPATAAALAFTQQPLLTQAGSVIDATTTPPDVKVQSVDAFGNLAYNTSIQMAIGANPGSGTLSGTTTQPTDANGIATFDDLSIGSVGIGYTLVASAPPSSPTASETSDAFVVAQSVSGCTGSCSGSATVPNNTILSVNASGTNTLNALGVTLFDLSVPAGVCNGFTQAPGVPGGYVDVSSLNFGSTGSPTLVMTWRLAKALVLQTADNGTAHYDICLGSVNLLHPDGVGVTGWPTKDGTPAVAKFDPVFGVTAFWGILPDCPKTPAGPCVVSRTKKNGEAITVFEAPYPWDPNPYLGH